VDRATLEVIGLATTVVGALLLTLAWLRARQRTVQLRDAVVHADKVAVREARTAAELRRTLEAATSGEREAAWSARMLAGGVTRRDAIVAAGGRELEEAALSAAASERQLDDLREQLRRLDEELTESHRRSDADATRLVEIETELVAAGGEINRLRAALHEARAAPATTAVAPDPAREEQLASALAETARLAEIVRALETALDAERRRPAGGIRPVPDERDTALARLAAETETANRVAAAARPASRHRGTGSVPRRT
jgi:chromosome segregation ATPase